MSGIGILSALAQLRVIGAVAADSSSVRSTAASLPTDFKALVCLYLGGGNDAMNVIVQNDAASYAAYAKARAELAVPQSSLRAIAAKKFNDGRSYALHPEVPQIHSLYAQGKLALLANVGMLVQPTTLAQYRTGSALPPHLFSHQDQSVQWQSSVPDRPFATGWGGRLADMVNAMNENNQISMSISLSGVNNFQRGNLVSQFAIKSSGVSNLQTGFAFNGVGTSAPGVENARSKALRALMASPQANLFSAAFAQTTEKALRDSDLLTGVFRNAPSLATPFPTTRTGANLAMVAKLISVAPTLGLKRQIFFVELGGFDLHGGQNEAHGYLLAELSGAMKAFYDATIELGVANQVTTFTASDFGRTYVPNSGGTDHGWGNHQMIMGGAVRGGDIYGRMPSFAVNGPDDTGRGRWIPSTSVDEYNATLARWFGVSDANLGVVLPNLHRFSSSNLGFMES